ncbi:Sulfate adenylyltransferase subunit 1 / Adenylyl-sulfate kinase (fragment) [Rhizobium sp. EC-SD404]
MLAVNKIDLVDFSQERFEAIRRDYEAFAASLGFRSIVAIPLSARFGDNVIAPSANMPWYGGPSLLGHLETVNVDDDLAGKPFRFPVQFVSRPHLNFRGFQGQVASGRIAVGDTVAVAKSGVTTRIKRIVTMAHDGTDCDLEEARDGQSVTLVLADEVDCSRGDILSTATERPSAADQFGCDIIWLSEHPLFAGRSYLLRTETQSINATITEIKASIDINTFVHIATKSISINEIGKCNISTQQRLVFDTYEENRATGSFVLIDRISNETVAAGLIRHPLRRAENIHWQALDIDRIARARQKKQQATVFWFTGLSGSGKSTIANFVEKRMHLEGRHTFILDGDNVRHGLNRDLGFTEADRVENIRRVAEVAKLMADAGLIVLVSFISPFRAEREMARQVIGPNEFVEIYVDTPFDECARRDPKGLYKKAFAGQLKNFTGIDSPYQPPLNPEIHLQTVQHSIEELVQQVYEYFEMHNGI